MSDFANKTNMSKTTDLITHHIKTFTDAHQKIVREFQKSSLKYKHSLMLNTQGLHIGCEKKGYYLHEKPEELNCKHCNFDLTKNFN